jgi:hypothetical protein
VLKNGLWCEKNISTSLYAHLQNFSSILTPCSHVEFEGLTAAVMKCTIFWGITPCVPLKANRRFDRTHRLHLHNRINRIRYQRECTQLATFFQASIFLGLFDTEDGGDMFLRNSIDFQRTTWRYIPDDSNLAYCVWNMLIRQNSDNWIILQNTNGSL